MEILNRVYSAAQQREATIVLAEAEDERVLRATAVIEKHNLARIILLGNERKIRSLMKKEDLTLDTQILNFAGLSKDGQQTMIDLLVKLRKKKGMTSLKAKKLLQADTKYLAALLILLKQADGYVAGNQCPTSDTLRPAVQLIGAREKYASSHFLMLLRSKALLFADCAFNIAPNEKELAQIALDTAASAKLYGIKPKVAFLSFSTHGSAEDASVTKVQKAVKLAKKRAPRVPMDGELQFDAAFVPSVAKLKAPKSRLKGQANTFIFPDLNSGNIAYKIAQRMAGAAAIGPILQGLKAPVNDLSRGCSVQDIVDVVAITAMQTKK